MAVQFVSLHVDLLQSQCVSLLKTETYAALTGVACWHPRDSS